MKSIAEQTKILADAFPIGCKVRVNPENLPGRVEGYQMGAHINRRGEIALRVHVPADTWVLYADQVEAVESEDEDIDVEVPIEVAPIEENVEVVNV